jgi:preprotein translocase subunit SecE
VQTTMIVVAFVLLVALLLWGLDAFLSWLVSRAIA